MIKELLANFGIAKVEDLTADELPIFNKMLEVLNRAPLSIEDMKNYIIQSKDIVETLLVKTDNDSRKDLYLKARLENYRLLEAFLTSPAKAKQALEKQIQAKKINIACSFRIE